MSFAGRKARTSTAAGGDSPAVRPVTVLAVDDQAAFRRALRGLIAATPGFQQVGEAATGQEAIALATEVEPDLVLLDVRMPDMDGLETARRLSEAQPRAIIVLISLEPPAEGSEAVGAAAHVLKQDLSTAALRELWAVHDPARDDR